MPGLPSLMKIVGLYFLPSLMCTWLHAQVDYIQMSSERTVILNHQPGGLNFMKITSGGYTIQHRKMSQLQRFFCCLAHCTTFGFAIHTMIESSMHNFSRYNIKQWIVPLAGYICLGKHSVRDRGHTVLSTFEH